MRFTRILIVILMIGGLISPAVWAAGKWTILRDDDIGRNDGIEGDLQDVHFTDAQNGWAVGFQGLILHTSDGGKTWTKKTVEMERPVDLWNLYFHTSDVGFITGIRGMILKTADGGKTWGRKNAINEARVRDGQPQPLRRRLTDTWMLDDKVGFMVGENSTFIKTTDGGEKWLGSGQRVAVGSTRQNLEKIVFVSPTEGWVVGSFGTLMHTTDGGETWKNQAAAGVDNNLMGIHFADAKMGWISGQEGLILHTTDGGATWTQQNTDSYDNLYDIVFVDKQIGWAVADYGTVMYTTDGGKTWTAKKVGRSTALKAIHAVDKDHCWAVGEWGLIAGYTVE